MRKFFWACVLCVFGFTALPQKIPAADTIIYGPQIFKVGKNGSLATTTSFSSAQAGVSAILQVVNGDARGTKKINSGTITFNGIQVITPTELNNSASTIKKPVTLNATNQLQISLSGISGNFVTITVYIPDSGSPPPTAALSATPSTISSGSNSTLTWTTTNTTSASISPDVGTVATSGSVPVLPAVTTTYTLTATGAGGTTTATTTVTVETGQTQPTTVFGPTTYKIGKSGALNITSSFTSSTGSGSVTITNGDGSGGKKITSGTLTLNGVQIVGPTQLNSGATTLEQTIVLQANNVLNVSLSGAFNSYVVVTVKHYPTEATAPSITNFTISATHNSFAVPITAFTATDNVGVTGYLVRESTTTPAASDPGWLAAPPASFTVATEGAHTLSAWAKDAAGNVSARAEATVVVTLPDTQAPTIGAFTVPAAHNAFAVPITAFTATDNVGVTGYLVRESTATPTAIDPGWLTAPPASFTVAAEGANTLQAWVRDAAGNVSAGVAADVYVSIPDVTAPTIELFELQPLVHVFAIPVQSFVVSDDAGVTGYLITETSQTPSLDDPGWSTSLPASHTVSAEGSYMLYAWAKDAEGNISVGVSATSTIVLQDISPPTVAQFTIPATHATLDIPILALSATDDVGVVATLVTASAATPALDDPGWTATPPTQHLVTTEGTHTLYAWAKDAASNLSVGVPATVTIALADTTPPMVQQFDLPLTHDSLIVPIVAFAVADNKAVTAYLLTETLTVPLVSDPRWQVTLPATFGFSAAGSHTLYAWAKDAGGNVSAGVSDTVTITLSDSVRPTIDTFALPGTHDALIVPLLVLTASDNVKVTGYLVTASATAPRPDGLGWKTSPPVSFTVAATGPHTLYAWAKDAAGNVSFGASAQVVVTASPAASTEVRYFYDALGQLSRVVGPSAGNVYRYDEVGNLLTVTSLTTTAAPPVLDSVTPNVLFVGKPQLVKISGQNLLTAESVASENPDVLIGYVSVRDTELVAEMLPVSPGSATFTVTTAYGTDTIDVDVATSSLAIKPGQTALLPNGSALLHLTVSPPLTVPVTFNIDNSRPSVASLPATVTIPVSGSTDLSVNGLSAGLSMITIGPEMAAVFVELPEQVTVDKLPSRPVSVYVQSSPDLATSASTGKISVAVAPSWTGVTDAASRRVSVLINSSQSLPGGASASAKGVSVLFDSSNSLTNGAAISAKGVSVRLDSSNFLESGVSAGAVSVLVVTPDENLAVPNVSPGVSILISPAP